MDDQTIRFSTQMSRKNRVENRIVWSSLLTSLDFEIKCREKIEWKIESFGHPCSTSLDFEIKCREKIEWKIESFGHPCSTSLDFEIKCREKIEWKIESFGSSRMTNDSIFHSNVEKKSSGKSNRLVIHARLRSILRSNVEKNRVENRIVWSSKDDQTIRFSLKCREKIEWKIESFGHPCSTSLDFEIKCREKIE